MRRTLLGIFAKAPVPGRVKTRLAAAIGEAAACDAYRELAGATARAVAAANVDRVVVFFLPDGGEASVRAMMGRDDWAYRPQRGADLGARMHAAFGDGLGDAEAMVIVGTDCPALTPGILDSAFARLDEAPVVLGPSRDGGYYLIGLTAPTPALFDEMPWSTDKVLTITTERAEDLGIRVELLEQLSDVDTHADYLDWKAGG